MTTTTQPSTIRIEDGIRFTQIHPGLSADEQALIDDIQSGKIQITAGFRPGDPVYPQPMTPAPPKPGSKETDPLGIDQHAPGAKLDSGKQLAGVLLDFSRALEAVADVGTFGANKYTRLGWESVPNGEQRYTDALMRHLLKMQREELDPDSGLEHLAHLAWNCLAVLELKRRSA